jgi:hypothetical protein
MDSSCFLIVGSDLSGGMKKFYIKVISSEEKIKEC